MKSIFTDIAHLPTDSELRSGLLSTFTIWKEIEDYVVATGHVSSQEWKYSGDKYGWSYRISDKKRVLIYLLPRDGFFKVAFVFGQKAFDTLIGGSVSDTIKNELKKAKAYSEGRGIRIEVRNATVIADIKKLIAIKIEN